MEDLSRLKANLATGKVRELDPPTYQVINALIGQIMQLQKALDIRLKVVEGGGSLSDLEILTASDESGDLPNSRELLAGARVAFDDTTPNERTVSATAIDQLSGDITAGPGSGNQVATIVNDAVTTAKILNQSVTLGKLQVIPASTLIGKGDSGAGNPEEIDLDATLEIIGTTLRVVSGTTGSDWDVLTDGDLIEPELIFDSLGEVIMLEIP